MAFDYSTSAEIATYLLGDQLIVNGTRVSERRVSVNMLVVIIGKSSVSIEQSRIEYMSLP